MKQTANDKLDESLAEKEKAGSFKDRKDESIAMRIKKEKN